jgi:hypothetical protein
LDLILLGETRILGGISMKLRLILLFTTLLVAAESANATTIFPLTDYENLGVRIAVSAHDGITNVLAIDEVIGVGARGHFEFDVVGLIDPHVSVISFSYESDRAVTAETVFGNTQIPLSVTVDEIGFAVGPLDGSDLILIPGSRSVRGSPQAWSVRGTIQAGDTTVSFEDTVNSTSQHNIIVGGAVNRVDQILVNAAAEHTFHVGETIEGIFYSTAIRFNSPPSGRYFYTPEPSTAFLLVSGLAALGVRRRTLGQSRTRFTA